MPNRSVTADKVAGERIRGRACMMHNSYTGYLPYPDVASVDVGYAPQSDRLLRCREMTRWARSDQSAVQQLVTWLDGSDGYRNYGAAQQTRRPDQAAH
jgi:hypothetical protein